MLKKMKLRMHALSKKIDSLKSKIKANTYWEKTLIVNGNNGKKAAECSKIYP